MWSLRWSLFWFIKNCYYVCIRNGNDITSDMTGFLNLPSKSSEQVKRLDDQQTKPQPQTMKKIYTYLFSAYNLLSEAIHLQLFPVPGHLKGLSQMQPVLVPTLNRKF